MTKTQTEQGTRSHVRREQLDYVAAFQQNRDLTNEQNVGMLS